MPFVAERRYFQALKSALTDDIQAEYEMAVNTVVGRYNTTVRENRFIVGGAVEIFTVALLRSAGIDAMQYSAQESGGDILFPNDVRLSVKGSHTSGWSAIGLLNKQGSGSRTWSTGTLFIRSGTGIVYGDPDMFDPTAINDDGSQLQLKGRAFRDHAEHNPRWIIPMNLDFKPPTERAALSELASAAVARTILDQLNLNILKQHSN